jgi:hypothetical protein
MNLTKLANVDFSFIKKKGENVKYFHHLYALFCPQLYYSDKKRRIVDVLIVKWKDGVEFNLVIFSIANTFFSLADIRKIQRHFFVSQNKIQQINLKRTMT